MTRKNQKIAQSAHILGRLNACANSVYQALLHFSCAPGTRLVWNERNVTCSTTQNISCREFESAPLSCGSYTRCRLDRLLGTGSPACGFSHDRRINFSPWSCLCLNFIFRLLRLSKLFIDRFVTYLAQGIYRLPCSCFIHAYTGMAG